jgi:hypothetical protein
VSDKAYDAFSRISSRAIDFISCIIFKTLIGEKRRGGEERGEERREKGRRGGDSIGWVV